MKILVTGGTGVIGTGLIPQLQAGGHAVRLLSRSADEDAKRWNDIESVSGDVSDAAVLDGAVAGCEAVIHIAGIATEHPPELTFQKVNVDGTKNVATAAERAGVRRFIFISSLGAEKGKTDYHKSKRAGEAIVESTNLDWTIVRPGAVYGPGDEVISNILKMVRALPAVPVIDDGSQEFQPIWHEDLGKALAAILGRKDLNHQTLELAGADVTSLNDLLERFGRITDRSPMRIPVPSLLAALATRITSAAIQLPIDETKITMLGENNVLAPENSNPLLTLLGITPIPLDEGLRRLADALPEQLPEEGVGKMEHKSYWAEILGSSMAPSALMADFCNRVTEIMPIEFAAEPGAAKRVELGATLTGALPMRGNFQVRVEVVEPTRVVFGTIEGHPLAGIVEFTTAKTPLGLRFAVDVFARAANFFDLLGIRTVGGPAQSANWKEVVQRMIDASGGTSEGVKHESRTLDEAEAARVNKRVKSLVQERQRDESAAESTT